MVIFLDVDGVLNRKVDWARPFSLNPSCVQAFAELVRKLEKRGTVEIILSSSWRAGLAKGSDGTLMAGTGDILGRVLQTHGLKISDVTPLSGKTRQEEIMYYVRRHGITEFLTLDDDDSLFTDPKAVNLYLVDYHMGLTKKDIRRIMRGK